MSIDYQTYERFSAYIYLLSLLSLVGLFVFGKNINGAQSWYQFGGMNLQPSEFAKMACSLAVAKFLSDRKTDLKSLNVQLKVVLLIFLPALFITVQPDPGSALIYFSFFFVLHREGLPTYYIIIGAVALVLFIFTLYTGFIFSLIFTISLVLILFAYLIYYKHKIISFQWIKLTLVLTILSIYIIGINFIYNNVFEQRHRDRFNILLGKETDTKGIGYNTNQSLETIKSGGLLGKGFLQGERTQGHFVPEQHIDYIFSTVGEEWGFVGSVIVIIVYLMFVWRILILAEKQRTSFARVYAYSIASIFLFHFVINVGMVIGLLPTIGIPLPFFSYGGSSLWGFIILLFIFIKLDANKFNEL